LHYTAKKLPSLPQWSTAFCSHSTAIAAIKFEPCLVISCWQACDNLVRRTDSQQVVPKNLILSARNKLLTKWWQQARNNFLYELPVLILLEQLVAILLPSPCNKVITTCSWLVTTTGNFREVASHGLLWPVRYFPV
jgi:hypothetical protein